MPNGLVGISPPPSKFEIVYETQECDRSPKRLFTHVKRHSSGRGATRRTNLHTPANYTPFGAYAGGSGDIITRHDLPYHTHTPPRRRRTTGATVRLVAAVVGGCVQACVCARRRCLLACSPDHNIRNAAYMSTARRHAFGFLPPFFRASTQSVLRSPTASSSVGFRTFETRDSAGRGAPVRPLLSTAPRHGIRCEGLSRRPTRTRNLCVKVCSHRTLAACTIVSASVCSIAVGTRTYLRFA